MKVVTLLSGGLDSATLLHELAQHPYEAEIIALSFNYGQRHAQRELAAAYVIAEDARLRYGRITHSVIDLTSLTPLLKGSALTDRNVVVPDGHYEAESMRATVVPNRNMVMLAIAGAVAVANHADAIAYGAHAGDHAIYPDCRVAFAGAVSLALQLGNEGFISPSFMMHAPFIRLDKADIVRKAMQHRVPVHMTYSCYKGELTHCGTCGTCVERHEAFELAGVEDPTVYAHANI